MAGRGPTVTLTFAGDADNLRAKVAQVIRDVDVIDDKIANVGKAGVIGFGAIAGSVLSVGAAAGVAALGIAAIPLAIGGAAALIISKNDEIKASFEEVGSAIKSTLAEATKPLEGTFKSIADQIKTFLSDNKGELTEMFAAAAPHIQVLADSLLRLAENLLPTFTQLMEDSKPVTEALGYAIETIGGAFGEALKILGGESDNAALGLRAVADAIAWAVIKAAELIAWLTSWIPTIRENWDLISGLGGALLTFGGTIYTVIKTVNLIKTAWMALSLAFSMSPLGLVIILVVGLVAALIYLWNTNEGFREAVIAAWEWIKEKAQQVWDAIGAAIDTAVNWISEKIDEIKAIPGKVRDWFEQMKMWAISKAVELVNWIKGLPQRILTALGNLGTLLVNAGRDLLTGLWNGITGAAGWLRDKIRGFFSGLLPQWAKNFLGIGSPSKVFRDEIGRWIPEGVAEGIEGNTSTVERASKGMASQALSAAAVSGVEGRSAGGAGVRSPEVRFTGNTSDALATVIMQLIRIGKIQIA